MTTAIEVIRAAIPGATEELADHVLWSRTQFPFKRLTAKDIYKAASGYKRAYDRQIDLCDFCDHKVPQGKYTCEKCSAALASAQNPAGGGE